MRVLVIIPANLKNGEMHFSTFIRTEIEALRSIGYVIKEFYFFNRMSVEGFRSSLRKLNKELKEFSPDIIHSHYGATCGLLVAVSKRNCPWVVTFGGSELLGHPNKGFYWRLREFISIKLTHWAADKANIIICVSENLRRELSISNQFKCVIIPRGVNTNFFYPQRASLITSSVLFSLPRNNAVVKNLPLAEATIDFYNKTYGGLLKLKILNSMKQEDIRLLFNNCSLLLVTSFHEGSPNIVKEAMACNVPVVSVDCGDVRSLLEGVDNSYVSESYNEEELANLMHKVISSNKNSSNGFDNLVNKGLDIKTCVKRISDIYSNLHYESINHNTSI